MYKHLAFLIALLVALTWAAHQDIHFAEINKAVEVCRNQTMQTTPTHEQCINNQFEGNNDQ